jgi:hypothetical protein
MELAARRRGIHRENRLDAASFSRSFFLIHVVGRESSYLLAARKS